MINYRDILIQALCYVRMQNQIIVYSHLKINFIYYNQKPRTTRIIDNIITMLPITTRFIFRILFRTYVLLSHNRRLLQSFNERTPWLIINESSGVFKRAWIFFIRAGHQSGTDNAYTDAKRQIQNGETREVEERGRFASKFSVVKKWDNFGANLIAVARWQNTPAFCRPRERLKKKGRLLQICEWHDRSEKRAEAAIKIIMNT